MKYVEVFVPEKTAYIVCIGDVHIGDRGFDGEGKRKLLDNLKWVHEHKNARVFLNGDIFNVAGRATKTSPFTSKSEEFQEAIEIFKPYRKQIIGGTDGNHENRAMEQFGPGYSPMLMLCAALEVPYFNWSCVVRLSVGKRPDNRWNQNYILYFHHTTGGGGMLGSKLNRVVKLAEIVEGVDIYFGSHNHQLIVAPQEIWYADFQGKKMERRERWYVDSGSYVSWDGSYAEMNQYPPTKLGSPIAELAGSYPQLTGHKINIVI